MMSLCLSMMIVLNEANGLTILNTICDSHALIGTKRGITQTLGLTVNRQENFLTVIMEKPFTLIPNLGLKNKALHK